MRTVFDRNLDELHREVIAMGVLVNRAIAKATEAFLTFDVEVAQDVIDGDTRINDIEHAIDKKCHEVIAMQHPNASDLRRVIAVLKASSNLERMGDHAASIAKLTIDTKDKKSNTELESLIFDLAEEVLFMSNDIIDAFVDFDVDAAYEIAKRDRKVDERYAAVRNHAIESMMADPETVYASSEYSFIGMHLERIGDYVTNICESIIYLDSGTVVDLKR